MSKILKYLRRTAAVVIGGLILLYFLDFGGLLPGSLHALLHLQIVPAILAGSFIALGLMFLLTLLFGRIYCSVICPLGILQDGILRCKIWYLQLAKKRKKYRTQYAKPLNYIRYGVFITVAAFFAAGITYPLLLLDPYSNFGRIAVALFRPGVIWVNNMLAAGLAGMGNYSLYNVSVDNTTWLVVGFAAAILALLIVLVWRRERIWCNTMCPVGTLLGFVSRFSLFRITLSDNCNNCKLCASSCKSRCIDSEHKAVDHSRCVTCFNCLDKCKRGAISYEPTGWSLNPKSQGAVEAFSICGKPSAATGPTSSKTVSSEAVSSAAASAGAQLTPPQVARRRFIKGSLLTLATAMSAKLFADTLSSDGYPDLETVAGAGPGGHDGGAVQRERSRYPLPPGAVSLERFRDKCTACQLCISKCPTQVLQPAFLENGLTGMMQPYMKFRTESFCNYECHECIDICPSRAILPLTLEEKKLTRVGNVHLLVHHCVVSEKHQDCGACAEHCPTQAVHMVPFGDGTLTIPAIEPDLCIGCGGCESICPVSPPAIFVEGLLVQERAAVPSEDKIDDVEVNDFGF